MREVVVVGSGVVGVSLAHALSRDGENMRGTKVTVVERDTLQPPRGSTAYAPGFVGLYNDQPILTALARESAEIYDAAGSGFRRSGGLELAASDSTASELERRVEAAQSMGLPSQMLPVSALPEAVASFVNTRQLTAAAHFGADGSADVTALVAALRKEAISCGVQFRPGQHVTGVEERRAAVVVTTASGDRFSADSVVFATGVWGPEVTALTGFELPLFPVAHPYVYAAPKSSWVPGPFVRWPEHHVYARVHGDRLGLGSYDHRPVHIAQRELDAGASLAWPESFTSVIDSAQRLLRPEACFVPERRVNGVFAMTPDNLPFLGRHPEMPNVWIAQALWVTHAAGAAALLATALRHEADVPQELNPARFTHTDAAQLRERALRLYRDIYANDAQ